MEEKQFYSIKRPGASSCQAKRNHQYIAIRAGAFGLFAGSLVLFPLIGFKLFPTSEKPIFLINLRMPR